MKRIGRNARGSAQIAELPPALAIIVFGFMIPVLTLTYLGLQYGIGIYYNDQLAKEAARTGASANSTDRTRQALPAQFAANLQNGSGILNLMHLSAPIETSILDAVAVDPENPAAQQQIRVQSTFTVEPLFKIPQILSEVKFTVSETRILEKADLSVESGAQRAGQILGQ